MFTLLFSSAKRESIARTLIEHLRQMEKKRCSRGIDKNTIVLFWHKTTCHVQNIHAFARIKISTRRVKVLYDIII